MNRLRIHVCMYLKLSWGWVQIFLCTVSWWSWTFQRLHPRPARSCTSSLGPEKLWRSRWTEKKTKMSCDANRICFLNFDVLLKKWISIIFVWKGGRVSMKFEFTSWLAVIRRRRLFLLSRDLRLAREDLMLGAPSRVCSCSARLSLGNTDSASVSSWDSGSF